MIYGSLYPSASTVLLVVPLDYSLCQRKFSSHHTPPTLPENLSLAIHQEQVQR